MVSELVGLLFVGAVLFAIILVALLFIWALRPAPRGRVRKDVKGDLKKIKDQVNGDD